MRWFENKQLASADLFSDESSQLQKDIVHTQLEGLDARFSSPETTTDPDVAIIKEKLEIKPEIQLSVEIAIRALKNFEMDPEQVGKQCKGALRQAINALDKRLPGRSKRRIERALRGQEDLQQALVLYMSYPLRNAMIQGREARTTLGALGTSYRTKLSEINPKDRLAQNKLRVAYRKMYATLLKNKETKQSSRAVLNNSALQQVKQRGEVLFDKQQRLIEKLPLVKGLELRDALSAGKVYDQFIKLLQYRANDAHIAKSDSAPKVRMRLVDKFADEIGKGAFTYDTDIGESLIDDQTLANILASFGYTRQHASLSFALPDNRDQPSPQEVAKPELQVAGNEAEEAVDTGDTKDTEVVEAPSDLELPGLPEPLKGADIILNTGWNTEDIIHKPLPTVSPTPESPEKEAPPVSLQLSLNKVLDYTNLNNKKIIYILEGAREPTLSYEYPKTYIIVHKSVAGVGNNVDTSLIHTWSQAGTFAYSILTDGTIVNFYPDVLWSGGGGPWSMIDGDALVNQKAIWVEFATEWADSPLTQAQIQSFGVLKAYITSHHPTIQKVVTSRQVVSDNGQKIQIEGDVHTDFSAPNPWELTALVVDEDASRYGDDIESLDADKLRAVQATIQEKIAVINIDLKKLPWNPNLVIGKKQMEVELTKIQTHLTALKAKAPTKSGLEEKKEPEKKPESWLGLLKISSPDSANIDKNIDTLKQSLITWPKWKEAASEKITKPLIDGSYDAVIVISVPITTNKTNTAYRKMMMDFFNQGGIYEQLVTSLKVKKYRVLFSDSDIADKSHGPYQASATEAINVVWFRKNTAGNGTETFGIKKFTTVDNALKNYVEWL